MGKKKKSEIPEWMRKFDETYHWSRDKGFYGHRNMKKMHRVKIIGCGGK